MLIKHSCITGCVTDMAERSPISHLAVEGLLDWSDGQISSVALVRLCRAARRDGVDIPMLVKLANCGSANLTHCYEQLKDLVLIGSGINDLLTPLSGPLYSWCIRPTTIFKMISKYPRQFKLQIAPSAESCKAFWRDLFSTPEGMELKRLHPQLRHRTLDELQYIAPLRMHEDQGPFSKSKGMNIISWSSLLGRGMEKTSKYQALVLKDRTIKK